MKATYFSGIDLHKHSSHIATVNSEGVVVKEAKVKNHSALITAYFASLPGTHKAVVESTPNWYRLADLLKEQRVDIALAHAKYLKAITYAKVKTDKVDARTLAQLLRLDMVPAAHQISPRWRGPRDILRTRLVLLNRRTMASNAMGLLCAKFNVGDVVDLPESYRLQAACYQQQIELLHQQMQTLEEALYPVLIPHPDTRRLIEVPGIGKLVAFTIMLEIDTINRFASEGQFLSYCRLVPGAKNSAGRTRQRASKDGNRYLKLAFTHAAVRAIQHYKEIKCFYRSKRRNKPEAIARTLVAKELARIVYQVLDKQENFNGCFKGVPLSRKKTLPAVFNRSWPLRASPAA